MNRRLHHGRAFAVGASMWIWWTSFAWRSAFSLTTTTGPRFLPSLLETTLTAHSTTTLETPVLLSHSSNNSSNISNINNHFSSSSKPKPSLQRVAHARPARRLNHAFKYLYRHGYNSTEHSSDPFSFLQDCGGYSTTELYEMNQTFPPLLQLSVASQLYPKWQFLQHTLLCGSQSILRTANVPPQYFGARLEKVLAPRHAFLVHHQLPHGTELFSSNGQKLQQFLNSGRRTKPFAALCRSWRQEQQQLATNTSTAIPSNITHKQVEAFDALFSRGLLAAARNELVQWNNSWPLEYIDMTSSQLVRLLVQHGACLQERDYRGATVLHWACGTGNFNTVQTIVELWPESITTPCTRDGSTPLHWAAAGATAREFGTGGHSAVCRYLLEQQQPTLVKEYVNQPTLDGNTALMWACWSGASLDTVKLLVRNRAGAHHSNRNGCTVAHWAASGGNLEICQYLQDIVKVNFFVSNHGGNTPLAHAVAFGRHAIVEWLQQQPQFYTSMGGGDEVAHRLALDFVDWTGGDRRRKEVLQLFDEWYTG